MAAASVRVPWGPMSATLSFPKAALSALAELFTTTRPSTNIRLLHESVVITFFASQAKAAMRMRRLELDDFLLSAIDSNN